LDTIISIPKKNTARRYKVFIDRFCHEFGNDDINQINSDDVLSFLNRQTEGNKPYTKRIRYAQLSAFFNFIRNNIDHESANPCDTPMIRKLYRERVVSRWKIIEKETVDEIIFRTTKIRNRLMLELMARGGMRIGEVLKLKMGDINERIGTCFLRGQVCQSGVCVSIFIWIQHVERRSIRQIIHIGP
jgi:site-specific recombinase XerD